MHSRSWEPQHHFSWCKHSSSPGLVLARSAHTCRSFHLVLGDSPGLGSNGEPSPVGTSVGFRTSGRPECAPVKPKKNCSPVLNGTSYGRPCRSARRSAQRSYLYFTRAEQPSVLALHNGGARNHHARLKPRAGKCLPCPWFWEQKPGCHGHLVSDTLDQD